MAILEAIERMAKDLSATLSERKGVHTLRIVIAERRAFLSRKRLEYIARFRIDDGGREVRFTEMLKESGWGLSSGPGEGMAPGFGVRKEVTRTGMGGREGTIEEQSTLFGKRYEYAFDCGAIRREAEAAARAAGYRFSYRITPLGL